MNTQPLKPKALAALVCAAVAGIAPTAGAAAAEPVWVATQTGAAEVRSVSGALATVAEALAPGQALHVVVSLKLRDPDALAARVARIQQGSRAEILTAAQLSVSHMPTAAQAQAVADYLQQAGFRNIEIAANRLLVSADGSAGVANAAFHTELRNVVIDGVRRYANAAPASVPEALAGTVLAVHGLQNVSSFHTMAVAAAVQPPQSLAVPRAAADAIADATTDVTTGADATADATAHADTAPDAKPNATSGVVGHNPTDFPVIYHAQGLAAASTATLGIISEGDLTATLSDLKLFTASASYATANATVTYVGSKGTDTSGTPEWDLDSQDALAAAGGKLKQIIFYAATSLDDGPLTQAYNQAVSDNLAKVVNISLGECETSAKSSGVLASDDQIFMAGMSQGQTFTVSTGDSGSHECTRRKNNGSYPAVSPYVMAIGGTTVTTSGTTTYQSEATWADGGGSPSTTETAPSWQQSSGVLGSSKARGVPDISFDADPNSGAIIYVNGKTAQYGGTSLAAPLFAGFWSRIQAANGNSLTSPDPAIYKNYKSTSYFHDVTSGSNGGYTAGTGWDYATGFGSVDIGALATYVAAHSGY